MRRLVIRAACGLALLPAFAPSLSAAPPFSPELVAAFADWQPPDISQVTRLCAQPFENSGSFVLQPRVTAGGAASDFIPADRHLEIREVRATLRGPGLRAGDLAVSVDGESGWYGMRREGAAIVWTAAADGPLHADRGSRIKFVAYRDAETDRAVSGDYRMRGCLVARVPSRLTRPDLDVPRLPEKRLTPLEPVERVPLRREGMRGR
ncbi:MULTISPECIES: hypothetical protein [Luteimonas]|uniref:hypothetical protein n=1 Tax=Luteimonas TaxID=83614 RepID=UPI000C79C461|nr:MULTISPECIES: hypothetical protein [Luteimonas]